MGASLTASEVGLGVLSTLVGAEAGGSPVTWIQRLFPSFHPRRVLHINDSLCLLTGRQEKCCSRGGDLGWQGEYMNSCLEHPGQQKQSKF